MSFSPPEAFNIFDYYLGRRIAEGSAGRRAILTDRGALTYGEVHELSGCYASLLLEAGARPEERILIALRDGPDYVAALFGILRMGGVVVMVNPDLKPDQIRHLYGYARARVALVASEVASAFRDAAEEATHAPLLMEVGGPEVRRSLARPHAEVEPFASHRDDAAIWLFSGGTTGSPKAVVQTHRSFANTTELYGKGVLGMRSDDITLSVPKLFFGYATGTNLFFPFAVGATAALFPERCTPDTLFEKIAAFRPTILVNVPTMVGQLVGHERAAEQDLSCLRLTTSAGEALPAALHRRWDDVFGTPLLDGLGTAEMWHVFISNRPGDVRPGTLGRPVPGFDVRVRDESGRDLGPDEVGCLWVRGDSLAVGYWQQMEKTREAFRGEWYVSGDMISMDPDGYVTYRGRADDMLKVSGKWLSPKELEDCLLAHEAVWEVAVVGARTPDGLVKPRAVVVPKGGRAANEALAAELQSWAKERLEPHKYPREVVFVPRLPRTHLGKVDRGKLARDASRPG
jgi:benzoate-CoA ligase family protein